MFSSLPARRFNAPGAIACPLTRRWCVAVSILVSVACAPIAVAQSDAELREENSALRAQVTELRIELAAAIARLEALTARIRELEAQSPPTVIPEGKGALPPTPEPVVTLDESNPVASPLTFLRHAQREYADSAASLGTYTTPRERTLYLRQLERWINLFNRRHRQPVEWLVRPTEREVVFGERLATVELVALDPGSGDILGDPFKATLTTAQYRRLETAVRRGGDPDWLVLIGTLAPQLSVKPERERPGTFDHPRFVGTFCEFAFTVEGVSLLPLVVETEAPPPAPVDSSAATRVGNGA